MIIYVFFKFLKPLTTRPSKQCEFCIYLDKSFDQSGLSEWFDWSGAGDPGGPGGPGGPGDPCGPGG